MRPQTTDESTITNFSCCDFFYDTSVARASINILLNQLLLLWKDLTLKADFGTTGLKVYALSFDTLFIIFKYEIWNFYKHPRVYLLIKKVGI